MLLKDQVAIVTGGSVGIGRACVDTMLDQGAKVMIADLNAPSDLDQRNGEACYERLDVSDEENWSKVVSACTDRWGRLDILVNNAGVSFREAGQTPETITLDEWRFVNSINTEGVVLGCKYAIKTMRHSGGGSIVNLASIAGRVESPMAYPYGASKAAVLQITKTVAGYCGRRGYNIRCNSVLPGPVATELLAQISAGDDMDVKRRIILSGELGEVKDVAQAVLFLASTNSKYINGVELPVDGGLLAVNPLRVHDERHTNP